MFHKKFLSFFYFAITIAVVVVVLKVIGWLPMVIQQDALRSYSSIEDIRSKLNINDIYIPSYMSQNFKWPPSRILAQKTPFVAIVIEFKNVENEEVALIISQTTRKGFVLNEKIKISHVKEEITYTLKGRTSLLEVGICKDDTPCSQISWHEGEYWLRIIMKSPPFDLIKIAESMLN